MAKRHPYPEQVYEERVDRAVQSARALGWPPLSSTKVMFDGSVRLYFGKDRWLDLPSTPPRALPADPGGHFGW